MTVPIAAESDEALARRIADAAGALLLAVRDSQLFAGKALGDTGDRLANDLILAALAAARPDDMVLSEESPDDVLRLGRRRVWIIDPLDGTREYTEGRSDWAVHIALAVDGVATTGAVALPAMGMTLCNKNPGALAAALTNLRMVVSRTRPASEATAVAERMGAELLPMGSAGAKAMAVVRGEADIYIHSGGQYEWDSCAPVAVAKAAGLHVSRIDGSPLVYNCANTYMPDLLICRADLASGILAMLASLRAEKETVAPA